MAKSLEVCKDIAIVQVSRCGQSLANDIVQFSPDVVLFDIRGEGAISEARGISEQCPNVRLLALAIPETLSDVLTCVDAGFVGYIPQYASFDELCAVMRHAQRGESACHPKILSGLFREVRRRRSRDVETLRSEPLTSREIEVLNLAARGLSNK